MDKVIDTLQGDISGVLTECHGSDFAFGLHLEPSEEHVGGFFYAAVEVPSISRHLTSAVFIRSIVFVAFLNEHSHFKCRQTDHWDCVSGPSAIVPESSWREIACIPLRYTELCDGYALNLLFFYIDPDAVDYALIHSHASDTQLAARLKSFHSLIRNIHRFYKAKLNRVITMSASPDVLSIVRHPVPEVSSHELNKVLILLLGCAVQSEQKEHFISRLRCMREELQAAIVHEISKVTEDGPACIEAAADVQALDLPSPDDHRCLAVLDYLEQVMKERDDYAAGILELSSAAGSGSNGMLTDDGDHDDKASNGTTTSSSSCNGDIPNGGKSFADEQFMDLRSLSPSAMDRRQNTEILELKTELRKMKEKYLGQEEYINEMQEESQKQEDEIKRLNEVRLSLLKDARMAQQYSEDIVYMQEQLDNARRLESENEKLREKVAEIVTCKKTNDRLTKTIRQMEETAIEMEYKLTTARKRLEESAELERKLTEAQNAHKNTLAERSAERDRLERLVIDNGRLEKEAKDYARKCHDLERRLFAMEDINMANSSHGSHDDSLASQLEMCDKSMMLELQMENKRLRSQLDNSTFAEPGELFDLKEQLAAATRSSESTAVELKRALAEIDQLREACSKAESKAEVLKQESEKASETVFEAKKQLTTLQSELQSVKGDDSTVRKLKDLETDLAAKEDIVTALTEEKRRAETQLERVRQQQKDSRVEVEAIRDEMAKMEQNMATTERTKKTVESERNSLKLKVNSLEDKCDELNAKVLNYENLERRLANNEAIVLEKSALIADLEADSRTTKQQLELETRKTQRLREDLVSEKSRIGDLLARLRSVCNAIRMNGGKLTADSEVLDSDDKLIDIIDDVIMQALNAARREADALRLQQQLQIAELDDLKKDIESLRKAEGELTESDDKVKELVTENKNVKEQVALLQERLRKLQVEESTRSAELQAARREVEELQTKSQQSNRHASEIAKLQVQLRNAQLQEELLREDNTEVRSQNESALRVKTELEKKLHTIEATQNALIADYDRLQNLHHLLGADYDRAKFELVQLKQRHKAEKVMTDGSARSEFVREKVHMESVYRQEREDHLQALRVAEDEVMRLSKELEEYRRENSNMLRNTDERSDELRRLRVAECSQKTTITSLNSTIQQLHQLMSGKDMEIAMLKRQVDMLRQYNGDENQSLIKQIELLLVKNQELHERSLNDKDTFHALQRDLQEQLVTLRRNKEKLEEKIMDQYKSMDSRKIKEKQTFVKRAAKVLMPKNSTRKAIRAAPPGALAGSTTEDSSVDESAHGFASPPPPAQAIMAGPSSNGQSNNNSTSTSTSTLKALQPAPPSTSSSTDSAMHRFFRRSSLLRRTNPLPRRTDSLSADSGVSNTSSTASGASLPPVPTGGQYASLRFKPPASPASPGVGCCGIPALVSRRAPMAAIEDDSGLALGRGRPASSYENA
uniref:Secreted protein n=1 Tax=Panagrellus redivivus TaxID=6233 RepID=A0A7E4VPH3_PANRE